MFAGNMKCVLIVTCIVLLMLVEDSEEAGSACYRGVVTVVRIVEENGKDISDAIDMPMYYYHLPGSRDHVLP